MFDNFFEYCRLDNSIFLSGIFWGLLLLLTSTRVIQFKMQEAKEKAIEDQIIQKFIDKH